MIDTLLREKIVARLSATAPAIPVGISNRHAAFDSGVDGADFPFKADAHQPGAWFAIANAGHSRGFTGGVDGLNGGDPSSRFNYA